MPKTIIEIDRKENDGLLLGRFKDTRARQDAQTQQTGLLSSQDQRQKPFHPRPHREGLQPAQARARMRSTTRTATGRTIASTTSNGRPIARISGTRTRRTRTARAREEIEAGRGRLLGRQAGGVPFA